MQDALGEGVTTGWQGLDNLYRVRPILPLDGLPQQMGLLFNASSQARQSLRSCHCIVCLQVVPGELSIVTGVPNSGKSEWIDALICNLARLHGWSFALCSMEKKARSCLSDSGSMSPA